MKQQKIIEKTKELISKRDGRKCTKCDSTNELTIDHIVPLSFLQAMGIQPKSTYSFRVHGENLQLLCRKCNVLKSYRFDWTDKRTRPLIEWYLDSIDVDLHDEEIDDDNL